MRPRLRRALAVEEGPLPAGEVDDGADERDGDEGDEEPDEELEHAGEGT
jgi:hypothetical protein